MKGRVVAVEVAGCAGHEIVAVAPSTHVADTPVCCSVHPTCTRLQVPEMERRSQALGSDHKPLQVCVFVVPSCAGLCASLSQPRQPSCRAKYTCQGSVLPMLLPPLLPLTHCCCHCCSQLRDLSRQVLQWMTDPSDAELAAACCRLIRAFPVALMGSLRIDHDMRRGVCVKKGREHCTRHACP